MFRKVLTDFSRLSVTINVQRKISLSSTNKIQASPVLWAEPLKKKKRIDPAVVKAREERKKKKIEKQIRRLEKHARTLKPIDECEVPLNILDEREKRTRSNTELPELETERRALLEKAWSKYKQEQHLNDLRMLDRIMFSQQKALDELRLESEELYLEAIQTDFNLIPYQSQGPTRTPPIEKYDAPDGDYVDVSKKWD